MAAEAIATAERATQRESENKAQAAAEGRMRRENLARFEKLSADSPLWDWAEFIGQGSELDKQAVAGAQKLSHRQADAEVALDRGVMAVGRPLEPPLLPCPEPVLAHQAGYPAAPGCKAAIPQFPRHSGTAIGAVRQGKGRPDSTMSSRWRRQTSRPPLQAK